MSRRLGLALLCALSGAVSFAGLACSDDSDEQADAGKTSGDGDTGDGDTGDGDTGDGDTGDGDVTPETPYWPMMGYDARNNYHNPNEVILNVDNADDLEVRWMFEVAGYPPGTPIVAEGKVFVLATGGAYAIDLETGKKVWSDSSITGTSSMAYHDGAVYAHTTPGANLYKLSAEDGTVLWGPVKTYDRAGSDGTSSPIVAGGMVYVGHSTSLEIQDPEGTQAEARGGVAAFKIEDGSEAWHYYTTELPENGAMVWSTVSADEDTVYASTGNNYTIMGDNSDSIHAISMADGSRIYASQVRQGDVWVLTDPMLRGNPDVDFGANPILADFDGQALVAAGDKASAFWVMDRATGEIKWQREDLSSGHGPATGGVLNNGAFDGKAFYVLSNQPPGQTVLVAMNPKDGKDVWAPKTFPKITWGMPITANGLLIVPINDELRIFNAETGKELKMFSTGGTIGAGAPAITGGRIIVASGLQYPLNNTVMNNNQIICYGLPE